MYVLFSAFIILKPNEINHNNQLQPDTRDFAPAGGLAEPWFHLLALAYSDYYDLFHTTFIF